jgi:hypothetical protein
MSIFACIVTRDEECDMRRCATLEDAKGWMEATVGEWVTEQLHLENKDQGFWEYEEIDEEEPEYNLYARIMEVKCDS